MRRLTVIGRIAGLIVGLFLAISDPPQPLLVPESSAINIDVLTADETLIKFALSNQGRLPLEIVNVFASCSCSDVSIDRKTVPGGESATLTVKVREKRRSATRTNRRRNN